MAKGIPRIRLRIGRNRPALVLVLAIGLGLVTAAMVWLGYRATREWQRSTALSLERRIDEVLALLSVALDRDMKGAQISVLVPMNQHSLLHRPPVDIADTVEHAFARFPYPESFFTWKANGTPEGETYFFNRLERPPAWNPAEGAQDPYPVVVLRDPPATRALVTRMRQFARFRKSIALLEAPIGPVNYQIVMHLFYSEGEQDTLVGLVGFTVNLDWVSQVYFGDILRQIQGIGGPRGGLSLSILDSDGRRVAAVGDLAAGGPVRERPFSLVFSDRSLISTLPPGAPVVKRWVVRVSAPRDPALLAATLGATRIFTLISVAAVATFAALFFVLRAMRASEELAAMKSEFVSTATHDLKTPLSLIQLIGDTLATDRYKSPETIADYARLLSNESAHLAGLVDNLLTFAHLSDSRTMYTFETLDMLDLVEDSLDRFRPKLAELAFDVKVLVPHDLPRVRGDRAMLTKVLVNLIDNSIKYAQKRREIAITGRTTRGRVHIEVADRGHGIPANELARVSDKFFRGSNVRKGGSGLGLAIARRIVGDHRGSVEIRSVLDEGTTVVVTLPVAKAA